MEKILNRSDPEDPNRSDPEDPKIGLTPRTPNRSDPEDPPHSWDS